jgi:hypothetical protein
VNGEDVVFEFDVDALISDLTTWVLFPEDLNF